MPDQIVACKLNVSLSAHEVDRGGIETVQLRETEIGFDPESASIVALDVAFQSLRCICN